MTRSLVLRLCAAGIAAGAGVVHLSLAPHHLSEAPPLGVAFALDGIAFLVVAIAISSGHRLGIPAAGALGAATAAGYFASRTVGLPGIHHHHGFDPVGLITTSGELTLAAVALARFAAPAGERAGAGLRRIALRATSAAIAAVIVSGMMVAARAHTQNVPAVPRPEAVTQATFAQSSADPDRAKPPGCLAITDRINLYAEQIVSPEGCASVTASNRARPRSRGRSSRWKRASAWR